MEGQHYWCYSRGILLPACPSNRSPVGCFTESWTMSHLHTQVEENRKYRLHAIQEKAGAITFINRRSVFGRFVLNAGRYVLVPSTFEPGKEREFLLRLYTERPNNALWVTIFSHVMSCGNHVTLPMCSYMKKDIPTRGFLGYLCCCCYGAPQSLVTVHLDTAQGLVKQDIMGAGMLFSSWFFCLKPELFRKAHCTYTLFLNFGANTWQGQSN